MKTCGRSVFLASGFALAAFGLGLSGCAKPTPMALERAVSVHAEAAADDEVARNAPEVLYEARKQLDSADRAWAQGDEGRAKHLAQLSELRVAQARALTRKRIADQRSAELSTKRDQIVLDARTREVDLARLEVEQARKRAQEEAERAAQLTQRATELEKALEDLKAERTDRGIVVTLGDVLFDFGSADLRPGAMQNLYSLVSALRNARDRELLVEGHTDSVGSDAYNLDLSRRRANAVRDFLSQNGIGPERIVSNGYGEGYPIAANTAPEGRQLNRRVEIVILEPGQSAAEVARRRALPSVGAQP